MYTRDNKLNLKKLPLALCGAILLASPYAQSYELEDDTGLIEGQTGFKYNESTFMKSLGIKAGGWTEIGANYNPDNPNTANGPVTFNDDPNSFNLHQVYGYISL